MRLIEYDTKLYAIWQEHYGRGPVQHVKCYNEDTDVWESVDFHPELGLSGFYFSNPAVTHGTSFYYGGAAVFNAELYVVWAHSYNGKEDMAIMKYNGSGWTKITGVKALDPQDRNHIWVTLAVHENALHLVSIARKTELTPTGQDDKRTYLRAYKYDEVTDQWELISNLINENIFDEAKSPSLISINGELYLTWREITSSNPDYSALPYKIFVKKYMGGVAWEFTGVNPVVSDFTFKPTLLNYKNTLTLMYGNNYKAYIKRFDGLKWVPFPDTNPVVKNISMQGQGKFPSHDVFSTIAVDDKIYFAWRPLSLLDNYLCSYID